MASSTNSDSGAGSRAPVKAAKGAGNGRVISTLFMKTQFCRFHSMGICARGSQCKFAHTQDERQPLPDFKCTKLCPTVDCADPSCRFAHSKYELRSVDLSRSQKPRRVDAREAVEGDDTDASLTATFPVGDGAHSMPVGLLKIAAREEHGKSTPPAAFRRTKLCKFFVAGCCLKQDDCTFAHGIQDLRTPPGLSCTKMCPKLISEGTCRDTACSYAHSKREVRGGSFSPQDSQPVTPQRLEDLATTESELSVAGHKSQPTQHGKQQREHKEEQRQLQQKQQAHNLQAFESRAWQLSMGPQVQQWQPMLVVPSNSLIPPQPARQGLAVPVSFVQVAVSPVVPAVGVPFSPPVSPVACGSQLAVAPGIQFPTVSVAHNSEMSCDFFEQQQQQQQQQRLPQTTSESDEDLSVRSNVNASKGLHDSSLWSRSTTSEMTDISRRSSTSGLESGAQSPTEGYECEDLALVEEQLGIAREQIENTFLEKRLQQAIVCGDVLRLRNTFFDVVSGDTPRHVGLRRKSDPCVLGRSPLFHTDEDFLGLSKPAHGTCAENGGLDAPQ